MKKYFLIISLVIVAVGLIALAGVFVFMILPYITTNGLGNGNGNGNGTEIEKTETAFGVKMQKECYDRLQNFLGEHGADYDKCLVDFNFKDEYCGGFDPESQGLSNANVIVILDASGSMALEINGRVKMDIAKEAVVNFLTKLPQSVNTGLVVYGHKGSNSAADKNTSCGGIEEVVKLGTNNNNNVVSSVNSFGPKGWTPIAASIDFAKNIFASKNQNDKNYLILVSDGAESCDGDPVDAAENLKSEFPNTKLSVIGFVADSTTRQLLTRVAALGGGSYISTDNSYTMANAFNNQLLMIKKDCINSTLAQMSWEYKNHTLENLDCWLMNYDKESADLKTLLEEKYSEKKYEECNMEVSEALKARHIEYWYKKQDLEGRNGQTYEKIESDLKKQLEELMSTKIYF